MLNESTVVLSEDVLMEDRIDFLKEKYPEVNTSHDTYAAHRKASDVIDFLAANADPTKSKAYTPWIVKNYHNGGFRQEDTSSVHEALTNFDKYKSKLPAEGRDINRYSKLSEIRAATAPHEGTATTKAELRAQLKDSNDIPGKHELVYEDDKVKIFHLKDKDTSIKMYSGSSKNPGAYKTQWCTAWADEGNRQCRYDDHVKDGPLFPVHRKSDGAVFQLHPATNQFMDKENEDVSKSDFADIGPSIAKAINQKHELFLSDGK
jgi:hypothetical protein